MSHFTRLTTAGHSRLGDVVEMLRSGAMPLMKLPKAVVEMLRSGAMHLTTPAIYASRYAVEVQQVARAPAPPAAEPVVAPGSAREDDDDGWGGGGGSKTTPKLMGRVRSRARARPPGTTSCQWARLLAAWRSGGPGGQAGGSALVANGRHCFM